MNNDCYECRIRSCSGEQLIGEIAVSNFKMGILLDELNIDSIHDLDWQIWREDTGDIQVNSFVV